jgi:glycosyltransferase involved in cell wall biosynthesis
MNDLLFVSLEPWDDIWRRNQFLCAALANRHPTMQILFVAPPRDWSNRVRRWRRSTEPQGATTETAPGFNNIWITRPLKLLPNSLPAGRQFNELLFRHHVRRTARELGLHSPVLWLNPHYAVHMAGCMNESAVVYDITDDWTSLTQSPHQVNLIRRQDAQLCRKADVTIVCSQRLHDMKRDHARNLHLIPNGVDADHYARVLGRTSPLPAAAANWPKPVLGYTGTIHPDRVDVELVASLARSHAGSIVLIGPNHLPAAQVERLRRLGNVFMPGPVPYAQIPDYMAAFDVCIVPHKMTPFTESLNPIKLWEYLAAGLPIVSTDVAGFRDYPELVRLAGTTDEFLAATRTALEEGAANAARRRSEAANHSWERRVDQIESVIASCIERRNGAPAAEVVHGI